MVDPFFGFRRCLRWCKRTIVTISARLSFLYAITTYVTSRSASRMGFGTLGNSMPVSGALGVGGCRAYTGGRLHPEEQRADVARACVGMPSAQRNEVEIHARSLTATPAQEYVRGVRA